MKIYQKILAEVLQTYMHLSDAEIERLLQDPSLVIKQRIEKIGDLEVLIYSDDHNPPHFHVKTHDWSIDAKFSIETGEYMSGEIDTKTLKKIKAFYNSPKTQLILTNIWNKRL